jgi:hypothetical protein
MNLRIEHSFILPPSSLSLDERIREGSFTWVNVDLNTKKIRESPKRLEPREVFLVSLKNILGREKMFTSFQKNNLSASSIYELLDLTIFFPEFTPYNPIYAFGTEITLRYAGIVEAYPCLKFSKKSKELSLPWYNGELSDETLYLCNAAIPQI